MDPLPNLAGRVLTGGRLNAFLPIAEPDSAAPAKITTLGVQGINGTWVALSWQATGDDGLTGRASNYQLRYSTSPLTEATFDSSALVPGTPAPYAGGFPETMTVSGLTFSTPYYFAIKAYDEFGNASPMSNVATATTLAPPDVSVSPASLDASLFSGQQTTRVLTLSNSGPSELKFKIDVVSQDSAGPQPAAAKIVGTFLPTNRTGNEHEERPRHVRPEHDAIRRRHTLRRGARAGPGGIKITNTFATGLRLLLLHSGSDVSEMRSLLSAFPDIALVDEFDARTTPVSLATLTPYDAVIVANNYAFGDPVALGDALADFSDQGGGVIVTVPSFVGGFEIRGRFLDQGYMPFNLGTGPTAGSTLGAFDASLPIMAGVTTASGQLLASVSLSPGAELVASWISGQPLVATKGKAVAFPMDDVLLYGLISKSSKPDDFAVVGKYLSVEPYAIMMRKDEPQLERVVNRALTDLFQSGEIRRIYAKWFATKDLTVPLNSLLKENFSTPNTYPAWP